MNNKQIEQMFPPFSPDSLLEEYQGLREPDPKRDSEYSPLSDGIMEAICNNLKQYAPSAFSGAWTSSLFPERLTKEVLRLFEQYLYQLAQGAGKESEGDVWVRAIKKLPPYTSDMFFCRWGKERFVKTGIELNDSPRRTFEWFNEYIPSSLLREAKDAGKESEGEAWEVIEEDMRHNAAFWKHDPLAMLRSLKQARDFITRKK